MLSLLLPALASVNVNLAILTYQSDARFTSAETCVAEWVNGTCWLAEPMQAVVAAALTAVTDFNARDAVALPVLGSLGACDKQLQFRLLDSGGTAAKSVRALGDLSGTDVVIGAVRSTVTATTAAITGALDIPQISYWSTSTDLRDPILFPRFMRTIPSSLAPASDLCSFWKDELGLSTVAVLYMQTTYGRAYEEAAKDACLGLGLTFLSRDIPDFFEGSSSQQSIRSAVASLSESGAKAVLVLASKPVLEFIVEVALDTGLLRAGVSWVFADSVVPEQLDDLSEKARAALNGSLSIKAVGATDGNLQWTKFANERWATLEPGDFNPSLPADWQIRGDFFSTVDPHTSTVLRNGGAFAYDAIIAAGLLACEVAPMGKVPASFGTQFWASKKSLSFDGLTGRVQFDEKGDRGNANVLLFNLRDQGGFSEKRVAQFNNGTCTWDGGSRESSGVIFNLGNNGLPPYLLVIIGVLASVGLMLCLCCLPVGRLVPPLSRIAASHGTNPWTLLRRRISRANKEPAEGPPDIERRPFVEQRLWASVLEQRLWGTAAREAAQLRAYLHVTRNTTPFIEACVEKLLSRGGTAACTQRSCNDDGCEASPDLEAPRLLRTISAPLVEQSRATLKMRDLLRFCLNEQGAGGRQLWEEWKIALCDLRSKERHRDASVHRDSASRQALRSLLDPRARGSSEAEPISVHESEPISVHEFASLLLSPCNSAIEQRSATEDATEPLTSYWIASSHNSFLEGDQLTSAVSADMYRRLLLSGTRCLEIDCWDPTTFGRWCGQGPRVTHRMPGGVSLLCGSVAFGEVVAAIAEHAFTSSPLPVILSIEMHCSAKQQKKIAKELVNTLGDLLSRSEHAASTPLRDLHRKASRCG
ncbi:hypothetical protein EMIHUDRAFT_215146 [Emiliania huxleyi CCMP1516]|uniref:Phosphoinositide phospholipase C n=2 Tax=Emiliania huxleyi TaxID=2903 RepID=A0A0D3II01_EMIH1|nr:hypothetical protein EMIHUDRAFT_215146 [Emiliania huxleyi CCMP1516]EOD10886.1 hypothetical protein EMIHUDRAFT_215146 [Emiliania huxleyi CCMP1516]|eukprot:XP_005763315.1 hypothetical protein EMIHUDRAFT_215146 [Emiliania huxleyi CCMP1516]